MAIEKLIKVTYHDFKLNEIIDPEKFDQNNKDLVEKIDEIVDTVNSQETDLEEINIKIDGAIDTANEAKELAEQANTKANEAINTANGIESIAVEAKTIAQTTESNFNNMSYEIYDWKEEVDNNIEGMQNIINEAVKGDANIEVGQAHVSDTKGKTFETIKERFEETEEDVKNIQGYITEAQYSTPEEVIADIISLPETAERGQIDIGINGKTYINLLGDAGDCEDLADWKKGGKHPTLDTSKKMFGNASYRLVKDNENGYIYEDILNIRLDKYYLLSTYINLETILSGAWQVTLYNYGAFNNPVKLSDILFTSVTELNRWVRVAIKFKSQKDTARLTLFGGGVSTGTVNFDGIMLNEITEEEYNNLSVDELMEKYPYVNGVGSTKCALRLRSVGKNLFDKNTAIKGYYINSSGNIATSSSGNYISDYIKIQESMNYVMNTSPVTGGYNAFYDINKNLISQSTSTNFTTPVNAKYVRLTIRADNIDIQQIEKGTVATPYEPYTESTEYIQVRDEAGEIVELHSLPNGVRDEIKDGKLLKRCSDKIIINGTETYVKGADGEGLYNFYISNWTTGKNVNSNNHDAIFISSGNYNRIFFPSVAPDRIYISIDYATLDVFSGKTSGTSTASDMKNYITANPITLIYQLAVPIIYDLNIQGQLISQPNGTIYIEPIIKNVTDYNSGITIADNDYPIKSLEKVYKIVGNTRQEIALSTCTVASDGKSFTSTVLSTGDKVEYEYIYDSALSTIPTIKYSYPMNLKAQVESNTDAIGDLAADQYYTETLVKSHLAEDVSSTNGVHGLKIENGVFTPNIRYSTSGTNYLTQSGVYVRNGNLVYINLILSLNNLEVQTDNTMFRIEGLPFPPKNNSALAIARLDGVSLVENAFSIYAQINVTENAIIFWYASNIELTIKYVRQKNNLKDALTINISGTYEIA